MRHLKQSGSVWKRTGISTSINMPDGILCGMKPITPRMRPKNATGSATPFLPERKSNGLRKNLISSASQSMPINFWISIRMKGMFSLNRVAMS